MFQPDAKMRETGISLLKSIQKHFYLDINESSWKISLFNNEVGQVPRTE